MCQCQQAYVPTTHIIKHTHSVSVTYPLVFEVVRVDVFQGNAHQMRWDVGKDAWQLFSCLQVGPGTGELHVAQVLTHIHTDTHTQHLKYLRLLLLQALLPIT